MTKKIDKPAAFARGAAMPAKLPRMSHWPEGQRASELLPKMEVGAALHFDLPEGQPRRRNAYQAVARCAHHWIGPGKYGMKSVKGGVNLTRLA